MLTSLTLPLEAEAGCCECGPSFYGPNGVNRYCTTGAYINEEALCLVACQEFGFFDYNNPPSGYPKFSNFCDPQDNCPLPLESCCVKIKASNRVVDKCIENVTLDGCKPEVIPITYEVEYYGTESCQEINCESMIGKVYGGQSTEPEEPAPLVEFKPQVTIPGSIDVGGKSFTINKGQGIIVDGTLLNKYIALVFKWFIWVIGIVAVAYLAFAGMQWLAAAGNPEAINQAKTTIRDTLIGLLLAAGSYVILFNVNPALVSIKTLRVEPIEALTLRPGLLDNLEAQSTAEYYKGLSCPSTSELISGIEFFTTGYYKPGYGDAEGYESFWCNIAMQCSCPNGLESNPTCSAPGGTWRPCKFFSDTTPYCNQTSPPPKVPQAWHTAAVSSCLSKGTVFKVFGSNQPGVDTAVWVAEDGGGWIKGRRIDLFFGTGHEAYSQAVRNTGEVIIKVCPGNDPANCPSS